MKKIAASLFAAAALLLSAMPVTAQTPPQLINGADQALATTKHPFPPAPPRLSGDCKEDKNEGESCILVCHDPQGKHRKWTWVEPEHLVKWYKKYPGDWTYDGSIFHFQCAWNVYFMRVANGS